MATAFGKDLTKGSIPRHLLLFSVPMLAGNAMQIGYSLINTIWVGHLVGENAVGAVGVSLPVLYVLPGFAMGMSIATTIVISQYYGAKDYRGVERADRGRFFPGPHHRIDPDGRRAAFERLPPAAHEDAAGELCYGLELPEDNPGRLHPLLFRDAHKLHAPGHRRHRDAPGVHVGGPRAERGPRPVLYRRGSGRSPTGASTGPPTRRSCRRPPR